MARGKQAEKLVAMLQVCAGQYTAQLLNTLYNLRSIPKGDPEITKAAKTVWAMKARTRVAYPSRYAMYCSRTLGLPIKRKRRTLADIASD